MQATAPLSDHAREAWVSDEAKKIGLDFAVKVMRGRREHGCDLGEVSLERLIEESRNEALDQLCYNAELSRRVGILLAHIGNLEKKITELEKQHGK